MIEDKIDNYLSEEFKNGIVDTKEFNNYKREYLNTIKKAERQLEKDMTLFVQKHRVNIESEEIKQRVADNIEAYFIDYVPEHVYDNIRKLINI